MAPNEDDHDDDLYGDLDTTLKKAGPGKSSGTEPNRRLSSGTMESARIIGRGGRSPFSPNGSEIRGDRDGRGSKPVAPLETAETASMRERIRILEAENSRLRRNMGTLFRTAKNEIQRKDAQIERLQQQQQQR